MKSPVAFRRLSVFAYVFLVVAVPASALWPLHSGELAAPVAAGMTSATLLEVSAPSPWLLVVSGLLVVALTVLHRLRKAPLFARAPVRR